MKVIIFGPTGGTGKHLVRLCAERRIPATAFARSPDKLGPVPAGVTVVQGDVLDAAAVSAAVAGHDAVLVALGLTSMGRLLWADDSISRGLANVLAAMRAAGAKRLVLCSSMGASESAPHVPGFVRWILTHPLAK